MKEYSVSMVSGLAGVIIGATIQFGINYQLIEKPKLRIEQQKTAIEVQKAISSLSTNLETSCSNTKLDNWTWHVECYVTNRGALPASAKIEEISIFALSDKKRTLYKQDDIFSVVSPEENYSPILNPGSRSYFDFHIKFSDEKYKDGIKDSTAGVNVLFEFETSQTAQQYLINSFPESESEIEYFSKSKLNFMTRLTEIKT
ncbi:hypothetical protein [Pseudomonas sp. 1928-m]|uniref:hypothetical protein n=1 Tax=Pseudomonas sp. 1928-m TaxID=3033804 RepID=UPI0023DEC52F|nr:hypothetical protein [Pseudomonas sp. 1928-m]MDF3195366.1 hypothetical protein [Pseudomonas sp. 1928-m]